MHIVFLTERIDRVGGIQRSLSIRANYLVEKYKYKVTIVCTEKETGIPAYNIDNSIKIIFLEKLDVKQHLIERVFLRYKQSKFILNKIQPDILITVKYTLHNLFFRFLRKAHVKLVSEIREPKQLYELNKNNSIKSLLNAKIRNYIFKRQNAVVVLTNADKKEWGFKNIYVVPNPRSIISEKKSDLESKQVLALGRLTKIKGFDKLIEVWKIVNKNYPNWILKIAGEGEEYPYLKKQIIKLGLQKTVILTNKFLPIENLFLNSSIYVMTSQYEAFGNVLVEAKTFGLPIVAFNAPHGPKEIIRDKIDGYLVELNNIEQMAEKIKYLIKNKEKRKKMGQLAFINSNQYNIQEIMEYYNKILLQL